MKFSSIILSSLKQSFSLIWKNKQLFLLIFILQIAFFSVFGYVNKTYGIRIIESSKAIDEYLSQQQLDEISVTENILQQRSILGDDPLLIGRNFNEIVRNFRLLLVLSFIIIVFFTSFLWAFTYKLTHKISFKELVKNFINILIISAFCYGLTFVFLYSMANISLADAEGLKLFDKYIPFLIFSLALLYFMIISFSLSNGKKLSDIVRKTLSIGIKKMHYVLVVYSINLLLFIFSIFLFAYFQERSLLVLLLSIILLIFSFVFGRIFVVNVVEKLKL